jgi:putative oxidoreductase
MAFVHDLGLLTGRLALGLAMASHGAQKAFGWFEGPGPEGAAGFMESLGFKPGSTFATLASYNEISAGLLVALGLGGPIGPAATIANMLVAQVSVHAKNGFYAAKGGIEVPYLYSAAALMLASSGYGELSLDAALGLQERLRHPLLTTLVIAGALAAGSAALVQRDLSPPPGTLATPTEQGRERDGAQAPATSPS